MHNPQLRCLVTSMCSAVLLAAGCAARTAPEGRIVKARWDSSLVNRAVDVLLRQATGHYTLWQFGQPGQFVVFIDSVPQLYSGFVVQFERDSVRIPRTCSAQGRIILVAWRPLPEMVGVHALLATVPGTPAGRATGSFAPPAQCREGGPDSLPRLSTYQVVDQSVRGLGHFAVSGSFQFGGSTRGPWTRRCREAGAKQWAADHAAHCEHAGFFVWLQADLVRADSVWLGSVAPRVRLELETFALPAKRYRVNCADRRSSYLCPSR